jgi:DNA-binding ferritin-like protein
MLNKLLTAFFVAVLLVLGFLYASKLQSAARVDAQNAAKVNAQDAQIASLLTQMQSADWNSRNIAFYQLLNLAFGGEFNGRTGQIPAALSVLSKKHPTNADEINLTLIGLLETENNLIKEHKKQYKLTGETLTEDYTDYYGDLIGTVAGLKDSRSVAALVGAITTGNMATSGLAELAPYSLDAVAEKADSSDHAIRNSATITLSQMLEPAKINRLEMDRPGTREKIKQILIKKARDVDYNVRLSAIDGLAKLHDDDK